MNTKEWLTQSKMLLKEIRALKEALEKSKSFQVDSRREHRDKYLSILQERIDRLSKINTEIISAIYQIEDCVLRTLLIERFINDRTWEYVARRLGYDYYHVVKYLFPKAVAEIDKIKKSTKKSSTVI